MKAKNVKELKEKIEAESKASFDFEQYLFKKYPSLFETAEDGELLPQSVRCWNDCPKGWEPIVDVLCGCIADYVDNTSRSIPNPDKKFLRSLSKVWEKITRHVYRWFNPYRKSTIVIGTKQREAIDKSFSMKVRRFTSKVGRFFYDKNLHVSVSPPAVKVEQYKEKFGALRFYIEGGDREVHGMIRFAEYLASKTCQNTGEEGSLASRNSWYATLSENESNRLGYSKNK